MLCVNTKRPEKKKHAPDWSGCATSSPCTTKRWRSQGSRFSNNTCPSDRPVPGYTSINKENKKQKAAPAGQRAQLPIPRADTTAKFVPSTFRPREARWPFQETRQNMSCCKRARTGSGASLRRRIAGPSSVAGGFDGAGGNAAATALAKQG